MSMTLSRAARHLTLAITNVTTKGRAAELNRYTTIRKFFLRSTVPVTHRPSSCKRITVLSRTFHQSRLWSSEENLKKQNGPDTSAKYAAQAQEQERVVEEQQKAHEMQLANYPRLYRRLAQSLPHIHRPTREDFLKVANGFWERMRIRWKWFTIKSFRKYNADDMSAFLTWFLMSQTVWIFVGTTTFFSVVFATINSLRLQEYVARAISDYLTSETGITVIFESAIVPKWKDSRISFKNVYISRTGKSIEDVSSSIDSSLQDSVPRLPKWKGSDEHAKEQHLQDGSQKQAHDPINKAGPSQEAHYSRFDLNVDSIDVTLSLAKWFDGKGLIQSASVKGVRGVWDRRDMETEDLDPASFRHKAVPGDFELDALQLEDVLITIYQPGEFRPYTASIFSADIKRFRKQWMFYDFLSAENVVGQFDNCLFSLHKPQSIGRTTLKDLKDGKWQRMSRFRIDGVNIDHLKVMTETEGPISWITSGKVDAVVDIKFPRDPTDDTTFDAILGDWAASISEAASSLSLSLSEPIPGQSELAKPPIRAPSNHVDKPTHINVNIDLRFRDLKAAVPMFTKQLSYTNLTLIRPIVAFMNANRTLVPIHCVISKELSQFDGAWTIWETGLMEDVSAKTFEALAYHVSHANLSRVKTVSMWSLQLTASTILSALEGLIDPMTAHIREFHM